MTALFVCSKIAKILGVKIISDGGIKASGDMAKALTLGDVVMCGGIFG
jgi:IMP dehydrogenase